MLDLKPLDKIDPGTQLSDLNKTKLSAIQRGLAICGYPVGDVDGLHGPKTRNAFAELVSDTGHGHTSLVSEDILTYLKSRNKKLITILASPSSTEEDVKDQIAAMFKFIGLPLTTQIAYGLATTQWETAHTFKPVREAFWLSESWRKKNLRYYPYYGRGYVQLTWENNYRMYSGILGLDLLGDPDLAMQPDVALFVLAHGMKTGTFTQRTLEQYVNRKSTDFFHARKVINGLDKARKIADIAEQYQNDL